MALVPLVALPSTDDSVNSNQESDLSQVADKTVLGVMTIIDQLYETIDTSKEYCSTKIQYDDRVIEMTLPSDRSKLELEEVDELIYRCMNVAIRSMWRSRSIDDMMESNELTFRDDLPCDLHYCWCKMNPDRARVEIDYLHYYDDLSLVVCDEGFGEVRSLTDGRSIDVDTESYRRSIEKIVVERLSSEYNIH